MAKTGWVRETACFASVIILATIVSYGCARALDVPSFHNRVCASGLFFIIAAVPTSVWYWIARGQVGWRRIIYAIVAAFMSCAVVYSFTRMVVVLIPFASLFLFPGCAFGSLMASGVRKIGLGSFSDCRDAFPESAELIRALTGE